MTTGSDRTGLSTAEIDGLLIATTKKRLINRQEEPTVLDRHNTPALNHFRKIARDRKKAIRGGYVAQVSTERDQDLQAYSGSDVLNYEDHDTVFELEFGVGNVHYGGKFVHQQLEEAGIPVDYGQAAQGRMRSISDLPAADKEAVHDLAQVKLDQMQNGYLQKLSLAFWRSNASNTKLWTGVDGMFPVTGNSTGTVGGKSRSNPALRHGLVTSVAGADLETTLDEKAEEANRYNADGSMINVLFCGIEVINTARDHFLGGSSVTPKAPIQRNAAIDSELSKVGLGIPDDVFYHRKTKQYLVYEPTFDKLQDLDAPAISWAKRIYGFNDMHFGFCSDPGKDMAEVVKPTPYNQQITYVSIYGEYAAKTDKPNAQFVVVLS